MLRIELYCPGNGTARRDPPPAFAIEGQKGNAYMTLEQELIEIFGSTPFPRNREILIGYYGWEDGRQHTLTEVGRRGSALRAERVRQICAKLTRRPKYAPIAPPVMDRALALIAERLPCSAAQIEGRAGRPGGLTAIGLPLESVAVGARGCSGRPVPLPHRRRAAAACEPRPAGGPARAGKDRRRHRRSGQEGDLLPRADDHGPRSTKAIARPAGQPRRPGAGAQDRHACWMASAGSTSRPAGSACCRSSGTGCRRRSTRCCRWPGRSPPPQLRKALARNRRLWKEPPPENVLLEFCRQMPGVRVEGERIISDPPRDWRKSLTGVEAKLVSVLKAHGPVMERGAMEDLCVADGMNRFSFHAFVSWSPVIAQFGHSVYGLLGTEVSREQVEELLAERRANRANRRVLDRHGRTDDGKVWLRYRLSKAASTYAVITVPAALKKMVRGRFQFVDRRRPRHRHAGHQGRPRLGPRRLSPQAGRADRRPHRPHPRPGRAHRHGDLGRRDQEE